jgi:hypothetical protein
MKSHRDSNTSVSNAFGKVALNEQYFIPIVLTYFLLAAALHLPLFHPRYNSEQPDLFDIKHCRGLRAFIFMHVSSIYHIYFGAGLGTWFTTISKRFSKGLIESHRSPSHHPHFLRLCIRLFHPGNHCDQPDLSKSNTFAIFNVLESIPGCVHLLKGLDPAHDRFLPTESGGVVDFVNGSSLVSGEQCVLTTSLPCDLEPILLGVVGDWRLVWA